MLRKYELNEDAVECPLCNEVLSLPIHQCKNGHIACGTCCKKLTGKECPFCRSMPFSNSRNLAMENVVESLWIACVHAPNGCKEVVKLTEKQIHAKACRYRMLRCPVERCHHGGRKLEMSEHFKSAHDAETVQLSSTTRSGRFKLSLGSSTRYVLIAADKELLLLHAFNDSVSEDICQRVRHLVSVFYCYSFGSNSLRYNLKVTGKGKEGTSSLSFTASVVNNRISRLRCILLGVDHYPPDVKNYVVLPNVNQDAELDLELTLL